MDTEQAPAYLSDPAREALSDQMHQVSTLEEVLEARSALRAWMQKYPGDIGMVDGAGEMLAMLEDCYREFAAEEAAMTEPERVAARQRRRLLSIAPSPVSMAEVEEAEQGLHSWLCEHPDDEEMRGLYPTLALFREMYEILAEGEGEEENVTHRLNAPALAAR